MAAEYGRNLPRQSENLLEQDSSHKWVYILSPKGYPAISLEEEIWHLRMYMEEMYMKEQSFTSPLVMEISEQLDKKINEFLQKNKRL